PSEAEIVSRSSGFRPVLGPEVWGVVDRVSPDRRGAPAGCAGAVRLLRLREVPDQDIRGGDSGVAVVFGGCFSALSLSQSAQVSSLVQVAGITLCLNAAAKISHRAQGIASLASKWHATATCSSADASQIRVSSSMGNLGVASTLGSVFINNSESDLEALEHITMPRNTHLGSYLSSYRKRQAFVLYLQMNPGGITIFGLTVDRGLINTIFFIEFELVLFVLGSTVVFIQ
ncbi:hypothetical protein C3L33_13891, partial [Rhododendron williamsianum]